jgi:CYTH domain-containing protein
MSQKYSLPEIERRWLVPKERLPALAAVPRRTIEDRYLEGSRLRLRAVFAEGEETVFKLGKKYRREGRAPEHVVSIYLTEQEYDVLRALPGVTARKVRYAVEGGSLDVYGHPPSAPMIFEMEFASQDAASAYRAPAFVGEEVTFIAVDSGYVLAQRTE